MSEKTNRLGRRVGRSALALLLVVGVVLAASALRHYASTFRIFSLDKIEIVGNRLVDAETVIARSGLTFGMSLGEIRLSDVEARLLRIPYFARVAVGRSYPGVVRIAVTERSPIAYLALKTLY